MSAGRRIVEAALFESESREDGVYWTGTENLIEAIDAALAQAERERDEALTRLYGAIDDAALAQTEKDGADRTIAEQAEALLAEREKTWQERFVLLDKRLAEAVGLLRVAMDDDSLSLADRFSEATAFLARIDRGAGA